MIGRTVICGLSIRVRQEFVRHTSWIRSHQTREEALAKGFAEVYWGGNREAELLAGQGIMGAWSGWGFPGRL